MSEKRFLQTLQALLTMVDPDSPTSVACVKATLENLLALATESGKADRLTVRTITTALNNIGFLIDQRDDFAGKPGDYQGNTAKQHRLAQMLEPHC